MILHRKLKLQIARFSSAIAVFTLLLWGGLGGALQTADAQQGRVSSLPIPRFVSLRTEPINMRTGPGVRYPVTWVYQRRNLPVEVTDEFDTWRRVRDPDGAEGWVHQSMLSGQRTGYVTALDSTLFKGSAPSSAVVAKISPGVVIVVDRCPKQIDLCLVDAKGTKGWLSRAAFWGLYENETID
ncbi:MAG: SH3 domain-containing protein [Rhodospirillaceae bacterium]